jgi:4-methyl-5(b-hydroxyethyl)-thiazole monophosphate biosynthesis
MRAAAAQRTALVPIADGSEEMEVRRDERGGAVCRRRRAAPSLFGVFSPHTSSPPLSKAIIIVDVLRRAGVAVTLASVEPGRTEVVCSRGVRVVADALLPAAAAAAPYDAVVLPGGMPGAARLAASDAVTSIVRDQDAAGRLVAAICAAPAVALAPAGVLAARKATAHPAFVDGLPDASLASARVVVDGHVVTSRGPGTAFEFALALVAALEGGAKAAEVAGPMVLPDAVAAPVTV